MLGLKCSVIFLSVNIRRFCLVLPQQHHRKRRYAGLSCRSPRPLKRQLLGKQPEGDLAIKPVVNISQNTAVFVINHREKGTKERIGNYFIIGFGHQLLKDELVTA